MPSRPLAAAVTVIIALTTAGCGHTPASGLLNSVAALWSPKSEANASAKAQPTVYGARAALSEPIEAQRADKSPNATPEVAPVVAKAQSAKSESPKPAPSSAIVATSTDTKRTSAISTSAGGPIRGADGKTKVTTPRTVTVAPGDTLLKIAEHHRVSVSALMAANRLQSLAVTPGQQLVIPPM